MQLAHAEGVPLSQFFSQDLSYGLPLSSIQPQQAVPAGAVCRWFMLKVMTAEGSCASHGTDWSSAAFTHLPASHMGYLGGQQCCISAQHVALTAPQHPHEPCTVEQQVVPAGQVCDRSQATRGGGGLVRTRVNTTTAWSISRS